jgi:chemotaxis protein methyltransferase CheR
LETTNKSLPVSDFLENVSFQKLKRLLAENVGLNCEGYRDEYLKRRFDVRLRATSSVTYGKYLIYLKKNPDEYQLLLNDLTINYTMFFRDPDVFQYLEKKIFPKLFESNNVRIWSAGCASGEEPYSLAILVRKVLGENDTSHHVTIYASDFDKDALAKASAGLYQPKQLQNLDERSISKYFTKEGELFRVNDCVRPLIRFEHGDLMKPQTHQSLDLILCRNVMIYFSKEGQQKIHMSFYDALREGGYFITGKAEMLSGEPSRKFQYIDIKTRVYQKPKQSDAHVQTGIFQSPVSNTPFKQVS